MPDHLFISLDPSTVQDGEEPEFVDSSRPLYAMYRDMTKEEDTKIAERWQRDAKAIFLFAGLFSAAIAPLVSVTILDLKPNPQDTSTFYLEKIYQLLADSNVSPASIPSSPAQPPSFSPPKYAVWVNSLWFLTLVINLSCAVLAVLLHQCTRRYLEITQQRQSSSQEQARIREFFANGIDELRWAVKVLPTLLHLSIFLFFSGLLLYLFNVHRSVFSAVVSWIAVSAVGYILITVMPIFWLNSPYYSPLSPLAWSLYACVLYSFFLVFSCASYFCIWVGNFDHLRKHYHDRFSQGMEKMIKTTVRNLSTEIDGRIVKSIVRSTLEDHELDRFVQCILSFCTSKVVNEPQGILRNLVGRRLSSVLTAFLDRTWSSDVASKLDKMQRFVICVKLADMARLSDVVLRILRDIFTSDNHVVLRSVETGHSLRRRDYGSFQEIGLCAQLVVAGIIANGDQGNKKWIALATDQLGEGLTRYLEHGRDSVLLANLIHVTRLIFDSFSEGLDTGHRISYIVLPSLSEFDIHNTLPELRQDFRALWNNISEASRFREPDDRFVHVLNGIRDIYSDLNPSNDTAPTPFPEIVAGVPIGTPPLIPPSPLSTHTTRGFPIPRSPPPTVPPVRSADPLALLSSTSPSRSTSHAALPRLRARGFVELFREPGRLIDQRGRGDGQESGGFQTPLVDATIRFLHEFAYEERRVAPTQARQRAALLKANEEEEEMKDVDVDSFIPTYTYDAMGMRRFDNIRGGQRDAEEFLRFYLDTLEKELFALLASTRLSRPPSFAPMVDRIEEFQSDEGRTEGGKHDEIVFPRGTHKEVKLIESPISRIFNGKFRSTLHTPDQPDDVVIEDWRSLQLDIERDSVYNIQDAVAQISLPQIVQVGPSDLDRAKKQVHIEALPPVLVLHLKRFQYDTATERVVKISKPVQFGPELEIPPGVMTPAARRIAQSTRYTLYGVLYHHGASASSGHYTLDVLHPNWDGSGEAWQRIDSENVSAVQHEDVFGYDNQVADDRCAYLLFYRCV